jgi:undecaprenyl-diphosphatase
LLSLVREESKINKIELRKQILRTTLKILGAHLTRGIIAGTLLLALFAKLAEDLLSQELGVFDTLVGSYIRSHASEGLTQLAVIITNMGSAAFEIGLLLVIGAYLYFRLKQVWEPLMLAVCLAGAWMLNNVLKALFHRTRPDVLHLVTAGGFSFPSGHAMIATAFYGMLGYIIWINLRQRAKPSWYVMVLTFCLVVAIGVSRVYLGVHYPSDVIAGFAAGGVWLLACVLALGVARRSNGRKTWPH